MNEKGKKRVLFLTPRLTSGGAERQMVNVALSLKQRGYSVCFLCYSYGDFFEKELIDNGIPVFWSQHNYVVRLIACTWFLHRKHYDVVISFLPTPSFLNCFAAMLCKRWRVITGERSSVVEKPTSLLGELYVWLRRYSDVIVCNSENACQLWANTFPGLKSKLTTIYNMVLDNGTCSDYVPKQDGRLHICIAATVYSVKNPIGVLNALLLMNNEQRRRIVIDWYGSNQAQLGDTRVFDELLSEIEKNRLQDSFRIHNATKDIINIMAQSDCVALFSQYEGLPNAICEAMMVGKPIIMTKVSDYRVLVEEGENGFLCEWDNPESIKNVIVKMSCLEVEELEKMGKRSSIIANKLFNEQNVINKWIKVIEQ